MTSAIDATKPAQGNAYTADMRANFNAAKNEIEALQAADQTLDGRIIALENAPPPQSAGRLLQALYSTLATQQNTNIVIPADNTIPQSNEGAQIFSLAFTPHAAGNLIHIDLSVMLSAGAQVSAIAALFRDSDANALAAVAQTAYTSYLVQLHMHAEFTAENTTQRTYKIRIGPSGTTTIYTNGTPGSVLFGGKAQSTFTVREYAAP